MARKRIPEESNDYCAHEQSASGSHPNWVVDPKWAGGIPGLYSLANLPKWSSEDVARFEERRAKRSAERAKEDEERYAREAEEQQRRILDGAAMLNVAPSKLTDPEVEARAWAKGYFRDNADEVSPAGSKRYAEKEYTKDTISSYERWLNDGTESLVKYLWRQRSWRPPAPGSMWSSSLPFSFSEATHSQIRSCAILSRTFCANITRRAKGGGPKRQPLHGAII
jgi:hypothetical protein